jgi:hypothetical protein
MTILGVLGYSTFNPNNSTFAESQGADLRVVILSLGYDALTSNLKPFLGG